VYMSLSLKLFFKDIFGVSQDEAWLKINYYSVDES